MPSPEQFVLEPIIMVEGMKGRWSCEMIWSSAEGMGSSRQGVPLLEEDAAGSLLYKEEQTLRRLEGKKDNVYV